MKRSFYLVLIVAGYSYGQSGEFKTYSNGLIYDEATMHRLSVIVDSLNLKFRSCDLSHPYFSYPQGMATVVTVPSKEARKLIESGVSLDEFSKTFPGSVKNKIWIAKTRYSDYRDETYIKYTGLPYGWSQEPSIRLKDKRVNDKTKGWILDEEEEDAFYLDKLDVKELPFDYARLVQYVDCMIDTSAQIYFPQAEARVYQRVDEFSKANMFILWAENFPGKPKYPSYERLGEKKFDKAYQTYGEKYSAWDSLRLINLDIQIKKSPYRKSVLMEAIEEGIASGNSDGRLEFYAARYISREEALKLMRSRKVMGNCSQDQSPRYHAMNICKLAAETAQWDIFLRSHLDIMNDRFERMSDGNYAWEGRKTYLKELEELDIPAIDLLLGTSLRVDHVSDNHYWGSIGRIGRALADATDKDQLEKRLLSMIQDEKLDPYNRLLMAYLFDNYAYNLDDEDRKKESKKKLDEAIEAMPEFMREVWGKG